jgi:hypothetical protein
MQQILINVLNRKVLYKIQEKNLRCFKDYHCSMIWWIMTFPSSLWILIDGFIQNIIMHTNVLWSTVFLASCLYSNDDTWSYYVHLYTTRECQGRLGFIWWNCVHLIIVRLWICKAIWLLWLTQCYCYVTHVIWQCLSCVFQIIYQQLISINTYYYY